MQKSPFDGGLLLARLNLDKLLPCGRRYFGLLNFFGSSPSSDTHVSNILLNVCRSTTGPTSRKTLAISLLGKIMSDSFNSSKWWLKMQA